MQYTFLFQIENPLKTHLQLASPFLSLQTRTAHLFSSKNLPHNLNFKERVSSIFQFKIKNLNMISIDRSQPIPDLKAIYNQYKANKYQEYRQSNPEMSNRQLTAKIVKEWNRLTSEQQINYEMLANVPQIELNLNLQQKPTITPDKLGLPNDMNSTNSKKSAQNEENQSDSKNDSDLLATPREKEEALPSAEKTKGIKKADRQDYINFFKTQFSKCSKEHPNWTCQQISLIIKLLWKRRVNLTKAASDKIVKKSIRQQMFKAPISGRMAFFRAKQGLHWNVKEMWSQLPRESRRLYAIKGGLRSYRPTKQNTMVLSIKKSEAPKSLAFMNWK